MSASKNPAEVFFLEYPNVHRADIGATLYANNVNIHTVF